MKETTNAERVGARIRKIRNLRHLTQQELGEKVGLTADRIQKYENGASNPRMGVLKNIAEALDCSIYALMDPVVSSPLGLMFALFEMEDIYRLSLERDTKNHAYVLKIPVQGDNHIVPTYLAMWAAKREQQSAVNNNRNQRDKYEERVLEEQESYALWKARFPESVTEEEVKRIKKQEIEEQIEKLKKQIEDLDS